MINKSSKSYWFYTTVLVMIGVIVLVRLGFWQLDRLDKRRVFNQRVVTQVMRPPLDLNQEFSPENLYDMEYRAVYGLGSFQPEDQVLLRNQVWDGKPGYHLLTPLLIKGSDFSVLVNRGWIPLENANLLYQYQVNGVVEISGIIRRPQSRPDFGGVPDPTLSPDKDRLAAWNIVNLDRIQNQVDYPLLPVYIQVTNDPSASDAPIPSFVEVELSEGSHFGYAIQWFSFAAILGLGYPFYLRKQIKTIS